MKIFGQHEPATLAQFDDVRSRAVDAALMADGHFGYVMPVGGVAAYRERVSVVGVGFDIACGNAAVRTDRTLADLGDTPEAAHAALAGLADDIHRAVSFGIGRKNAADDAPVDDPLFEDPAWRALPGSKKEANAIKQKARAQLGTVGSGNHYVDVFADEQQRLWVGVHFGSRGFGHGVASAFLALGQGLRWDQRAPEREVLLDLAQPLGHDYWHLMALAGRYAYAGREWVARKVVALMGAREEELVHNHHNFAWKEAHASPDGGTEELVVVRKGATPAFPGRRGSWAGRWATTR
jgi:tRNA-splicing ligase RtcB